MSEVKPWKTLSFEVVYQNDRFKVRKDTCLLPDGTIRQEYFVIEQPDVACVCAVTKNGEVVLVQQFRQGTGQITLELPGGFLSRHDLSLAETARRELLEETGYSSERLEEVATWYVDEPSSPQQVKVFLAPDAEKVAAPKHDPGEYTEVVLKLLPAAKQAIDSGELKGAIHAAALSRCLERLGFFKVV